MPGTGPRLNLDTDLTSRNRHDDSAMKEPVKMMGRLDFPLQDKDVVDPKP